MEDDFVILIKMIRYICMKLIMIADHRVTMIMSVNTIILTVLIHVF
jgi:hypothetical protein